MGLFARNGLDGGLIVEWGQREYREEGGCSGCVSAVNVSSDLRWTLRFCLYMFRFSREQNETEPALRLHGRLCT